MQAGCCDIRALLLVMLLFVSLLLWMWGLACPSEATQSGCMAKKVETSNSYYNLTSPLLPSRLLLLLHFLTGHDVSQNGSLGHRVSPHLLNKWWWNKNSILRSNFSVGKTRSPWKSQYVLLINVWTIWLYWVKYDLTQYAAYKKKAFVHYIGSQFGFEYQT